jgi:hypothetical protein
VKRVSRSQWLLHLGAVALATCALATACRGSASSRVEPVQTRGNSLLLIDARSAKVVADVPVGRDPARVAYGGRAFWVVSPGAGSVLRVGVDKKAATRVHIGKLPYDVAVGAGALWIPDHDRRRLFRFDLESHALRATRDLGLPAISVGFGFRSVWVVVADGSLLRINPRTLHEESSISDVTRAIEGSEPKLAVGRSSVWILTPAEGSIAQVDPTRGTVERRIPIEARGISAGGGAVWVADKVNAVWRLDEGRPQRIPVGLAPQDVVATSKDLWVAIYGDKTLVRLDPRSRRVRARIKLDRRPAALAAGGGIVAVGMLAGPP